MHEHILNTQPRIVKKPEYLNTKPTLKQAYLTTIHREPVYSTHNHRIPLIYLFFNKHSLV